jgi:hypothetical protein
LGYDKDAYGDLVINQKEAKIVRMIFEEYLSGKGVDKIAKEFNMKNIKTVTGAKWVGSSVLGILKNEKYKGDALLQKYYTLDYLSKKMKRNTGQVDSFYIQENHSPIVSKEMWERVQEEIQKRAKAKGNIAGEREKYTKRYPLTGMLYCSKCGSAFD